MPNGTPPSESGGQEDKAPPAAASPQNGGTSESDSTLESDATSEHNDTDASGNTSSPAAGESPTPPSGGQGFPGMADTEKDGNFGGRGGAGADLVYTDDEIDSYSTIFDSAVFDSDEADYERVIEALKQLNEGADLESAVDVDSTLRYIAANAVLVNLDSYFGTMLHNYYLYEEDGRLSVLPWDYNLSFGGFQSGDASAAVNFPIDTPVSGATLAERPLIGKLLEVEEYQETYHSYLRQIVDGYFLNGTFANTIKMIDSLIGDYVRTDPTAFYTYDEYVEATGMLEDFGQLRALSVDGQLNGTIPSTTDGQKEDSASLIDASSINLAVMGTQGGMGGGRAEMGMGRPDGMGNDTASQAGESSGQSGEAAGQPGESTGQPGEAAVKTDGATDQTGDVPGQPPGGTDTPDGEGPSGFPGGGQDVQMPDADTIAKALEIVGEDADKLSGEQKARLLELGLSEEQIAMVQQMLLGGGNFPGGGKILRTGSMPGAGQDSDSALIELAIAGGGAALLLLATAFAALKKRRRDVRR
ncbi:CotH kinase family protein [Oscillospiraceae bacterium NSJ-54]|uniref:CotH kinase family protein n=2 Tax=Zongyangia hominis TaxID=2763677 RepID=A0A926E8R1_9FIRM|nr:CotH kinase family protein [Zongyangia hominis]